jgi:hypothetical protein
MSGRQSCCKRLIRFDTTNPPGDEREFGANIRIERPIGEVFAYVSDPEYRRW